MKVVCQHFQCGASGEIPEGQLGQRVQCPSCGSVFTLMGQTMFPVGCSERPTSGWRIYQPSIPQTNQKQCTDVNTEDTDRVAHNALAQIKAHQQVSRFAQESANPKKGFWRRLFGIGGRGNQTSSSQAEVKTSDRKENQRVPPLHASSPEKEVSQALNDVVLGGDRDALGKLIQLCMNRKDGGALLSSALVVAKGTKWHALAKDLEQALRDYPNKQKEKLTESESQNLVEVKARLRADQSFAEFTASRKGKNLEHWMPPLSSKEIAEALCTAQSVRSVQPDQGTRYWNNEWNFGLTIPKDWEVVFENKIDDFPWAQPVRIAGPQGKRAQSYLTVVTSIVEDDGQDLNAYMAKAESDFRKNFKKFSLLDKRTGALLGWPSAWMTIGYHGDSGPRQELNVTTFFGKGQMLWFQFVCETDKESVSRDFPVFEGIMGSLQIGSVGLRHPQVSLAGASACGLCGRPFVSGMKSHSVINLKTGRLMGVCDECRKTA